MSTVSAAGIMQTGRVENQRAGYPEQLTSHMPASAPVQLPDKYNIDLTAQFPQNQSPHVPLASTLDPGQPHQVSYSGNEHSPAVYNIQSPESSNESLYPQNKPDIFNANSLINPLQHPQTNNTFPEHFVSHQMYTTQNCPQVTSVSTFDRFDGGSVIEPQMSHLSLSPQYNAQGSTDHGSEILNEIVPGSDVDYCSNDIQPQLDPSFLDPQLGALASASLDSEIVKDVLAMSEERESHVQSIDVGGGGQPQFPRLTFQHEPSDKFRFRYLSENGQHGCLASKDSMGGTRLCPTVKVENMRGRVDVRVRLFTWDPDPSKCIQHEILRFKKSEARVKTGETLTLGELTDELVYTLDADKDHTCQLNDIIILRLIKGNLMDLGMNGNNATRMCSEFSKKEVCLRVEAVSEQDIITPAVFSSKIIDERMAGSPKIKRLFQLPLDRSDRPEFILFTSKFKKGDIQVKVEDSAGNAYCCDILDLHSQAAIHCRMPPNIKESIVSIFLYQPKEGETSDHWPLTDLPCTHKDLIKKRKHTGDWEPLSVDPPVTKASHLEYQRPENLGPNQQQDRPVLHPTRYQPSQQGHASQTPNIHPTSLPHNNLSWYIHPLYDQTTRNPRLMADDFNLPVGEVSSNLSQLNISFPSFEDFDTEYDCASDVEVESCVTASESPKEKEELERPQRVLQIHDDAEEKSTSKIHSAVKKHEDEGNPSCANEKTPSEDDKCTVFEGNFKQNKTRKEFRLLLPKEDSECNELKINDFDEVGLIALHVAVMAGSEAGVRKLLDRGADVHKGSRVNGDTALHMALRNGHTHILSLLILRDEADVFMVNDAGDSVVDLVGQLPRDHPARTIISDHLKACGVELPTETWGSDSEEEEES